MNMEAEGPLKTTTGKVSQNVALTLVLGSKDRWRRGLAIVPHELVEEACEKVACHASSRGEGFCCDIFPVMCI